MADYDEMNEAEEEALLKSDDEYDLRNPTKTLLTGLVPPDEEDSLMNEAAQLDANIEQRDAAMDESDSDDDSEDDKAFAEYKKLLTEIEGNQYVYDKYLKLCELAHNTEDLDNIRNAYNLFATVYPLSSDLWLKFLSIEISLAVSEQEIVRLESLFKRALSDYYSIDVALTFANFASKIADPENVWDELIGTYGCSCMKGQEFFKIYRRQLADRKSVNSEKRQELFVKSYCRELKLPLNNMEESYIEFKVFYEKNKTQIPNTLDWQDIDRDYYKAKSSFEKILPYETKLSLVDAKSYREKYVIYEEYIKDADDFLDENILQTIYERMVTDCCLNPVCWLAYINFIDERDEIYGRPEQLLDLPLFKQNALDICGRALRNCTWAEQLYIKRMQLMEKREQSREVIQEVLESSLSAGFQTAEPAVAIWLEYLTYLRRHTNWESEEECEILRKNFNLAWTILGQQWGVLADCNCEILQFWGRLEYGPLRDPKRGKELWSTVMESADNATKSGLWIEFLNLELRRDLDSTRKLYRKALHTEGLDNPLVITSAWDRFERCNGSISTHNSCQKECTSFLAKYNAQYSKAGAGKFIKRKSDSANENPETNKRSRGQPAGTSKPKSQSGDKTAESKNQSARDVTFKEHENAEIDLTKDHLRIFLSNLDYNLNEDDIRANLPELQIVKVDLIRSANGRSRGFGYLELANETEVEKALALDRRSLNNRPLYVSSVLRDKEKRQKFKYSDGLEPRKLFVKFLPQDTKKEEVETMFSKYGKVQEVRLVYHKSGKFKNIAYVEFAEESAASKAVLGMNNMELRGQQLEVAISAPPPKPSAHSNVVKTFSLPTKRNKPVTEQRPRMSLIPRVLRKQLETGVKTPAPNGAIQAPNPKTNADFRKLLEK